MMLTHLMTYSDVQCRTMTYTDYLCDHNLRVFFITLATRATHATHATQATQTNAC